MSEDNKLIDSNKVCHFSSVSPFGGGYVYRRWQHAFAPLWFRAEAHKHSVNERLPYKKLSKLSTFRNYASQCLLTF